MHFKYSFFLVCLVLLASAVAAQEPGTATVDFELVPSGPYYLGSTIEKIKIDALYSDGSRVPLETIGSPSLNIERERQDLDLEEDPESDSVIAEVNYTIELDEEFARSRDNVVEFELYDLLGQGIRVEKDFEVNDEHPSLKARLKNPPPYERVFEGIELPFEIELTKGADATNEKVYVTDNRDFENKRECQKLSEEGEKLKFQCLEQIPLMEETRRLYYVVLATADIAGEEITVYEISENEITNSVRIDVRFPPAREPIPLDEVENRIEVDFSYGMGESLEGGSYNGTINGEQVEFVWDDGEKAYVAEFDFKSLGEGEHELEFTVEGIELEHDTATVEFFPEGAFDGFGPADDGLDMLFIIGAVVAVLAVFTFIVWFLVLRKKKEETADELKEEAAMLKEMLKRIEIDYYKRRLNEAEYKKRSLEYQTRLDKTLAKIKAKKAVGGGKQK